MEKILKELALQYYELAVLYHEINQVDAVLFIRDLTNQINTYNGVVKEVHQKAVPQINGDAFDQCRYR